MDAGLTGVLVLDKPRGISSMTAVEIVRKRAAGARTGHAGTLDPLATGVLVIALGKATKCIDQLMATDKRYHTIIDLSAFTTTDDLQGERTEIHVPLAPTRQLIDQALVQFTGNIMQRPPAFSAIKVGGKRAYKMARQGQPLELQSRPVRVHAIHVLRYDWPQLELNIHCAKGVYVRSLARDLGVAMGTGGHCVAICRTAVGPFTLAMASSIDALPSAITRSHVLSIEHALQMVHESAVVAADRA
jgi:tRNA pseudouridine55 synthase